MPGQGAGRYRMSASTGSSPFTSCFACFVRALLGDLDRASDDERTEWARYLQSLQQEDTGLFRVELLDQSPQAHDALYRSWQLTTFCLSALDALGATPRHPLLFLANEGFNDPQRLSHWLDSQDWRRPWYVGNLVMFLQIMILASLRRDPSCGLSESARRFFEWHDTHQNPRTGFWGEGASSEYYLGLFGAYHQYVLYFYANRFLHCKARIIDRTLRLQNLDGLFAPEMGGGGCEDMDGADTLVQLTLTTDYRRADIKRALRRAYQAFLPLRHPLGGYRWGIRRRYGPAVGLRVLAAPALLKTDLRQWYYLNKSYWREQIRVPRARPVHGWTDAPIPWEESDLFSTWVRLYTVAQMARVLTDLPEHGAAYHFLQTPGLGWGPE